MRRPHPLLDRSLLALALSALLTAGCRPAAQGGHSHGPGGHSHGDHAHGSGGGDHAEDEGASASFTLFTDTHELFVELDVPVAGERGSHHAHVTRLVDNAPATSGTFAVAFLAAGGSERVAQSYAVSDVARTGIFTPSGRAPEQPGSYRLVYRYQSNDAVSEWDAGVIEVGLEPTPPEAPPEGEIIFLKETSWFLPFRVRKPELSRIARTVTAAARVEADPSSSASITAPASGRVLWGSAGQAVVAGRAVKSGEVLGRLRPESSYASWNALELELRQARAELDQATAELRRVEPLVADGLLPERRLLELRAAHERARLAQAGALSEGSAREGKAPSVELRSPLDGLVLELLVEQGDRAEMGRPLARLASTDRVILRGLVRGATPAELERVRHAVARPGDPSRTVDLIAAGAELLAPARLASPRGSGIPVSWTVPNEEGGLLVGELVELTLGLGAPVEQLTIPVDAVVEVNTRPYAFVQKTGESFERRALTLGSSDGTRVAVVAGLDASDLVVAEGGFEVYVASLAGTVESHRH